MFFKSDLHYVAMQVFTERCICNLRMPAEMSTKRCESNNDERTTTQNNVYNPMLELQQRMVGRSVSQSRKNRVCWDITTYNHIETRLIREDPFLTWCSTTFWQLTINWRAGWIHLLLCWCYHYNHPVLSNFPVYISYLLTEQVRWINQISIPAQVKQFYIPSKGANQWN